jgi:hypothetical protein
MLYLVQQSRINDEDSTMISIYRCHLENDQWTSIERRPTGRGFTLMSEDTEYDGGLNGWEWPRPPRGNTKKP